MVIKARKWTATAKEDKETKEKQYFNKEDEKLDELKERMKKNGENLDNFEFVDPLEEAPVIKEKPTSLTKSDNLIENLQIYYYGTQARILDESTSTSLKNLIQEQIKKRYNKNE
jgi:hypothetical protein